LIDIFSPVREDFLPPFDRSDASSDALGRRDGSLDPSEDR
jgi:hypothetical protein